MTLVRECAWAVHVSALEYGLWAPIGVTGDVHGQW